MRVWNVIAWAGRAAPSSRTSGKRNKQGTPKTGLQDKKSAHERETLAPRTKTQLRPVRTVPDPFAPRAVLLQQSQSQLLRGPLQPNRIPMRIILHRLHQPRPDRVGYDISGQRLEVILPAHCPIMKTPLPYASPDSPRTNTPHPPHHSAE